MMVGALNSKQIHGPRVGQVEDKNLEVHSLVDWKVDGNGDIVLLVHWLGFEIADRTWGPLRRLFVQVPELARDYSYVASDPDGTLRYAVSDMDAA